MFVIIKDVKQLPSLHQPAAAHGKTSSYSVITELLFHVLEIKEWKKDSSDSSSVCSRLS